MREDSDRYKNTALIKSLITGYEDAIKIKREIISLINGLQESDSEFSGCDKLNVNTY